MRGLGRTIATAAVTLILAGLVLFGAFGAFKTGDDLDRDAERLDASVAGAEAATPDAGAVSGAAQGELLVGAHSLPVAGKGTIVLEHLALDDHQGREVLRVRRIESVLDLDAIKRGVYRVTEGTVEGAHVTLYRDHTGRLTLSRALRESSAPVRRGLAMPPGPSQTIGDEDEPSSETEPWLMEIGPLHATNVTLTLGFTEKPVVLHVDRAKITVQRRAGDTGPIIHLSDVEGRMVKPDPLPKPVMIAYAEGVVRPSGHPLVSLTARTCMGGDELRVKAVVPAREKGVDLTVDSAGFVAALGQMGLKIASRKKTDKLRYQSGAVRLGHGKKCSVKNIKGPEPEPANPEQPSSPG